jgi:hypothetical protein
MAVLELRLPDLLALFSGFAAGAEAVAIVAERLALIEIETAGSRMGYLGARRQRLGFRCRCRAHKGD